MAYVAPSTRTTGTLITAAIWNQDIVDNPIALRAGGIAIASQAANDIPYASSATQLGRIAAAASAVLVTSAGSVPSLSTILPAVDGSALTGLPNQVTLLKANSGTTTSAVAENVDTVAISGLTAKDTLLVYVTWEAVTAQTASVLLYNSTDSVQ